MRVGIICAGDRELAPFIPMMEHTVVTEKAMLHFHSGAIDGVPVVTLFCGVCKTNAAIATQILIDTYGCDAIINAGTAGGMDAQIALFDTVISTEVCHHDVDGRILTEFHPWMDSIWFQADRQLVMASEKAVRNNAIQRVRWGRMATGETFVENHQRDAINGSLSPLCVDMETASIAQTCYVNRIPFIAVRTITDTAEHSGSGSFESNCDKASAISANVAKVILREMQPPCRTGCAAGRQSPADN